MEVSKITAVMPMAIPRPVRKLRNRYDRKLEVVRRNKSGNSIYDPGSMISDYDLASAITGSSLAARRAGHTLNRIPVPSDVPSAASTAHQGAATGNDG